MNSSFGFIIIRHVNSEKTNKYWNHSIKCLRSLYPLKKIVIIDDNSDPNYLKSEFEYKNIEIIQSEFKGRGELLPYYYYIKYQFFDNAVIIHDSVFFHKKIHFELLQNVKVLPLWFFHADKENINNTINITSRLKNNYYLKNKLLLDNPVLGMNNSKWYGCFGVQSYINHEFLLHLENKYKITNLISCVLCRADRCCLERIFGCIFFTENPKILNQKALLGNIMKYDKWGDTYDDYITNIKIKKNKSVVKVWTGR
jgi:hypothetical protein